MPISFLDKKLKEICLVTGAIWAVWFEKNDGWDKKAGYSLSKKNQTHLIDHLTRPPVAGWVDTIINQERSKWRKVQPKDGLGCENLYFFPDPTTRRIVILGAEKLSIGAQKFIGNYINELQYQARINSAQASKSGIVKFTPGSIPSHSPEALRQALSVVQEFVGSTDGWLAIRSGDQFEIRVHTNQKTGRGERIPIESNPMLRDIVQSRIPRLIDKNDPEWPMVPQVANTKEQECWAAIPLVMGHQLIGLIGLWLGSAPRKVVWEQISSLAASISPSVEGSIVFDDLSDHLRRLALLNDFSVTISSAVDIEQIVQRLFRLLGRTFETDRIVLLARSPDGTNFHQYFMIETTVISQLLPPQDAPLFWSLEKGEVLRVDSTHLKPAYKPFYANSASALVVPLKYRRQVIGALGLEDTKEGTFSIYDEHLLAVIASHLAGLLENIRLRQEAEERARNLGLIHDVVEQVIGLNDVDQVAKIAAELLAKNFAYELAGVALFDHEQVVRLVGIGGSAAQIVRRTLDGQETNMLHGIVGRVALTGESLFVNDVGQEPLYLPLPNWEAGSEMCVALKDGEIILGVIDVESQKKNAFSNNDLIVLESLAGILSSVISKTGQYQKQVEIVTQLKKTRMELQERISAQRMAESRLVQAAKLAAVGEMAAGIAHELNNPLTTVSGFTELIIEGLAADAEIRPELELVHKEAQRARAVVRRLLDFARQSESVRARSDVNEIINDVLALTNHLLHTSGVQLTTNLPEELPWPPVDRNQIKQVILNLIHNALHAMPAGGELTLATFTEKNGVGIRIQDSGVGIPPDHLERIFEPFFTTRSKEGGTGLGLSVSYGIIVDHGGDISVESTVGVGTIFTIWLPFEEDK